MDSYGYLANKLPFICPRGLWMTPYQKIEYHHSVLLILQTGIDATAFIMRHWGITYHTSY